MDVVVVGSALIDIVIKTTEDFKILTKNSKKYLSIPFGSKVGISNLEFYAGGSGHNVAVGLARFGHQVSFVGKVGNDYLGNKIIQDFKRHGVHTHNLQIKKNGKTGFSLDFLSKGEKTLIVYDGFNLDLSPSDLPKKDLENSEWFVFTSILSKSSLKFLKRAIEFAKQNNVKILANPSIRMVELRRKELINFLKSSDIAIMNEEEIKELARTKNVIDSMRKLYRLGVEEIVVTLGSRGALAYDGSMIYHQKGFRVRVVDPTGCGDSFTAGFLHYISKGKDISEALKFANANAALNIQSFGATENLPKEESVLNFILSH